MLKHILFFFVFSCSVFAYDRVYFLPNEAKEVKNQIISLIENADRSIDIAMYSIDEKDFTKALKKASKNGVKITVFYGKTKLKFHKKIDLIETKRKQHIKLAIIDDKTVIYGSANWKKESFGKNYEIINITDESLKVQRFVDIMDQLKNEN